MLPLTVDEEGFFIAARDYNDKDTVGPDFWERPS
jgi:ubiquinol-cytochrome c reductase iron-sulfur subunit